MAAKRRKSASVSVPREFRVCSRYADGHVQCQPWEYNNLDRTKARIRKLFVADPHVRSGATRRFAEFRGSVRVPRLR